MGLTLAILNFIERIEFSHGVKVFIDPSTSELKGMIKNSRPEELRGIKHEGTYYVWDSPTAIHYQIIDYLSINMNKDIHLLFLEQAYVRTYQL
jgi:hypothetical protein